MTHLQYHIPFRCQRGLIGRCVNLPRLVPVVGCAPRWEDGLAAGRGCKRVLGLFKPNPLGQIVNQAIEVRLAGGADAEGGNDQCRGKQCEQGTPIY